MKKLNKFVANIPIKTFSISFYIILLVIEALIFILNKDNNDKIIEYSLFCFFGSILIVVYKFYCDNYSNKTNNN